jgi:uncharacterized membrane protein
MNHSWYTGSNQVKQNKIKGECVKLHISIFPDKCQTSQVIYFRIVGKIYYSPTVFTNKPLQSQAQEIAREPKWLKKKKDTYMPAFTITPQSVEKVYQLLF